MGAARPMTVRLDPRPARPLTSREISKIIGGALGGLMSDGVPALEVRNGLAVVRCGIVGEVGVDVVPTHHGWIAALAGVVGGVMQWCDQREVLVAIDWLLAHWSEIAP